MKLIYSFFIILVFVSCNASNDEKTEAETKAPEQTLEFDSKKWKVKREGKYKYRDAMLNDLVADEEIRKLKKEELFEQLGKPDFYRGDRNYLYYTIFEKKFGPITLNSKTLVIKLNEETTVEWMKIHD